MSNLKKKLQNPFAIVAQGFVAGVLLFWTTLPREADYQDQAQTAAVSVQDAAYAA